MGQVANAVTHAVSNVVNTVTTVVTNPAKANIGQIASVVNPLTLIAPVDAAQHKEDRPILAAATAASVAGAYAFGNPPLGVAGPLATHTSSAALAGGGAASVLGMAKSATKVAETVATLAGNDGGGGPVAPPSNTTPPPLFGPTGPSGGDFGVWETGGGGGSGNVYANPAASGTTTPAKITWYIAGGVFLFILLIAMGKKAGR